MPSGLQSKDSRKAHILDRKAFIFFELISSFFNELFEYYLNINFKSKQNCNLVRISRNLNSC